MGSTVIEFDCPAPITVRDRCPGSYFSYGRLISLSFYPRRLNNNLRRVWGRNSDSTVVSTSLKDWQHPHRLAFLTYLGSSVTGLWHFGRAARRSAYPKNRPLRVGLAFEVHPRPAHLQRLDLPDDFDTYPPDHGIRISFFYCKNQGVYH